MVLENSETLKHPKLSSNVKTKSEQLKILDKDHGVNLGWSSQ